MFISDPAQFIRQNVISVGGHINTYYLYENKDKLISHEGKLLSFTETENRYRVFVKRWIEQEEEDSDTEVDEEWEQEKKEMQALHGYIATPRNFGWKSMQSVIIDPSPPNIYTSAHSLDLDGNEGGQGKRAYVLPWMEDGICWTQLGDKADYFFTDAMTGCTFGVGGDPRSPIVLHSNVGAADKRLAQTLVQLEYITKKLPIGVQASPLTLHGKEKQYKSSSEGDNLLTPKGYIASGTVANIVGWRRMGEWQFWCQRYMVYRGQGPQQGSQRFTDIDVTKLTY